MFFLKSLAALICGIPFLLNLPYMAASWRHSALDRWDWILLLVFLVNGSFQLPKVYSFRKAKFDWVALIPIGSFSALALLCKFHYDINAPVLLGTAVVWWSSFWFLFGWRSAYCLIGSFLILMLGCTSTTYWISYMTMIQGTTALIAKFIAAGILVVLDLFNRRLLVRRGTLCFMLVLAGGGVILLQARAMNTRSPSFLLDFSSLHFQDYLGRRQAVEEPTRRFFAHSKVEQYSFADNDTSFGVLAVECGNDIHEIHPASHCLRTTGASIISEYPVEYNIHGTIITVNEIEAILKRQHILVTVWYSNEDFSTSNFIGFRRAWRPNKRWMTYQISAPVINESPMAAREMMTRFLNAIPSTLNRTPEKHADKQPQELQ